jgi:hypothetical protein
MDRSDETYNMKNKEKKNKKMEKKWIPYWYVKRYVYFYTFTKIIVVHCIWMNFHL